MMALSLSLLKSMTNDTTVKQHCSKFIMPDRGKLHLDGFLQRNHICGGDVPAAFIKLIYNKKTDTHEYE